ncbi:hypothetical protein BDD12DRAFT_823143 [Trichophaea hybrida]|nr:hypothetical protein BDD12DRAFT_823143 [Trichophaea hybrida]
MGTGFSSLSLHFPSLVTCGGVTLSLTSNLCVLRGRTKTNAMDKMTGYLPNPFLEDSITSERKHYAAIPRTKLRWIIIILGL